jgi:hypothetical protein
MTLAIATERRLEPRSRCPGDHGQVRDRPEGLNEADTKAVSAIFREPDAALARMIVKRAQDLQLVEIRVLVDQRLDVLALQDPVTGHPEPISSWLEKLG